MLARRVAYERGTALGGEVGYRVRFDRCIGAGTRIIYETDGILLQELRRDPDLRRVGAIVFDEFHERHIFGDILLGLALDLQAHRRPDLKIVVMSATLDAAALEQFLAPTGANAAGLGAGSSGVEAVARAYRQWAYFNFHARRP
jgi:ATP-dependent helicase HrpB